MQISPPRRKRHSYTQSLVAPPEQVFPLLCPVREVDWTPDWDPELVLSESGVAEQGCVFITPAQPQAAIWVISQYDPRHHRLEMYKITPGHTVGRIVISLAAAPPGTQAEVAYEFTALGAAGETFLDEFTADWYREFMQSWEKMLNHHLLTGSKIS